MRLLLLIVVLIANGAQGAELDCKAWRQKRGEAHVQVPMPFDVVHPITGDRQYRAEIEGYRYRVDWNPTEGLMRATIVFTSLSHNHGTLGVPSSDVRNVSSLDATRDDGERVSIDCLMN